MPPLIDLDRQAIKNFAALGLTHAEIAAVMGVSKSLISDKYRWDVQEGHELRNGVIRRAQFECAKKGNPAMLIWLGKQYLGQRENPDLSDVATDELLARARAYFAGVGEAVGDPAADLGNGAIPHPVQPERSQDQD